jgi:hypothetical protein
MNSIDNTKIEFHQVSIENIRWILYPVDGKPIVENHQFERTWKKTYKENFGRIDSICFQLIPESEKFFIDKSPTNEYWIFEEFVCQFGGTPQHINRNLCSRINENDWNVITIDYTKTPKRSIMSTEEIGYNIDYINQK